MQKSLFQREVSPARCAEPNQSSSPKLGKLTAKANKSRQRRAPLASTVLGLPVWPTHPAYLRQRYQAQGAVELGLGQEGIVSSDEVPDLSATRKNQLSEPALKQQHAGASQLFCATDASELAHEPPVADYI